MPSVWLYSHLPVAVSCRCLVLPLPRTETRRTLRAWTPRRNLLTPLQIVIVAATHAP
jgi:hypothetical protein